jgi:prepilin-type N-terminal cleavage/methylation domain-containing protein
MTTQTHNKKATALSMSKGFTLIELLVVIGILAILLAITLIAINPARQFAQANNTKRASDVTAILNAVGQYAADNKGNIAALGTISTTPATPTAISAAGIGNAFCTTLVTEYIAALPTDPLTANGTAVQEADCVAGGTWNTGYTMYRSAADSRITVTAPATESPATTPITVTR